MGENLRAEGRAAVRTPMQWTSDENGGFSRAAPDRLAAPVVPGRYGPARVNVASQLRDPDSLLAWMSLLIHRYRQCPEFAWGDVTILDQDVPAVLAHRADHDGGTIVALHNLDSEPARVTLRLDGVDPGVRLIDLLADAAPTVDRDGAVRLRLDGYGCRWLRVVHRGTLPPSPYA